MIKAPYLIFFLTFNLKCVPNSCKLVHLDILSTDGESLQMQTSNYPFFIHYKYERVLIRLQASVSIHLDTD